MDVELQCACPKVDMTIDAAEGCVAVFAIEYVSLAIDHAPVLVFFQSCS
jgi:hypothetical protein